jgi:hypothetical protein
MHSRQFISSPSKACSGADEVAKGKRKAAKIRVRREWVRSPVQKPHSTKKGEKGYKRTRLKLNAGKEEELT